MTRHFQKENEEFTKSAKGWFEKLDNKTSKDKKDPQIQDMKEFEEFWESIWRQPEKLDREKLTELKEIMTLYDKVENEMNKEPNLSIGLLSKSLKKMRPWSGTGWDQLYAFMWQKMTSINKLPLQVIVNLSKNSESPTWQTLGRTVLVGKKNKRSDKPENFGPIACLSIIYKIQSSLANSALRSHLFSNNILPFEQLGMVERTFGAKDAILFDWMINREVRLYKRNLYIGWTDVRKAYDSIYQEFIIDILQYVKAPKWIIQWLKKA